MTCCYRLACGVLFAIALFVSAAPGGGGGAPVELKKVKYAQLADIIEQNRGKVILVDLWHMS